MQRLDRILAVIDPTVEVQVGAAKAARLRQLLAGVGEIPAVRVPRHATLVICDEGAAG